MYCRYRLVLSNSGIILVVFSTNTKVNQYPLSGRLWHLVTHTRGDRRKLLEGNESAELDSFSVDDIAPLFLLTYEHHKIKISQIFESNNFPDFEEVIDDYSFEEKMQIARKNSAKRGLWARDIKNKHTQLFEAYNETRDWTSCKILAFFVRILLKFCLRNKIRNQNW